MNKQKLRQFIILSIFEKFEFKEKITGVFSKNDLKHLELQYNHKTISDGYIIHLRNNKIMFIALTENGYEGIEYNFNGKKL